MCATFPNLRPVPARLYDHGMEFLKRHTGEFSLGLLVLYLAVLGTLAADRVFHLGIVPTPLEKRLRALISDLDDPAKRDAARNELVDHWNEVAAPELMRAMEKGSPAVREQARACLAAIAKTDHGDDVRAWKAWWKEYDAGGKPK